MTNKLFYGDNLDVLRQHIRDESVDLVYLDPPFNSNANYNLLFKSPSGEKSQAQIEAFEDTWHWNIHAARAFDEVLTGPNAQAANMLRAIHGFLGENDMMAYLAMMAVRLIELHRVLKPTGSLYLHCDPTASHYLKILLDAIFGKENFLNEIVWKRTTSHNDARNKFADVSDKIFFFSKSEKYVFKKQFREHDQKYIETKYHYKDENGRVYRLSDLRSPSLRPNLVYEYKGYKPHPNGWAMSRERMEEADALGLLEFPKKPDGRIQYRRFLDTLEGMPITNVWDDIPPINAMAQERLGYPTQKPVALLERILSASSNEGDVVLDPFCGCGTTVHAAQKLNRQWIGIDITHLAISLIERRLKDAFPGIAFTVEGTPKDLAGARDLAARDKYQFQWWATSLIGAVPAGGKKKGADRGIDGFLNFRDAEKKPVFAIVSVKGGEKVSAPMIRDLKGVMEREKAVMGVFITLAPPTRDMVAEAAAGFYETGGKKFAKIQILTIEDLFDGRNVQIPFGFTEGFKKPEKEKDVRQKSLF